jgi:hypothetical protein
LVGLLKISMRMISRENLAGDILGFLGELFAPEDGSAAKGEGEHSLDEEAQSLRGGASPRFSRSVLSSDTSLSALTIQVPAVTLLLGHLLH